MTAPRRTYGDTHTGLSDLDITVVTPEKDRYNSRHFEYTTDSCRIVDSLEAAQRSLARF